MNAQLNALRRAACDAQQFDSIAQFFGVFDVAAFQTADAFQITRAKIHGRAKCQRRHNGDFVSRIMSFNIKSGVGFGVTQFLCQLQRIGKTLSFFAHLREDKIAGAVDNARNRLNAVGRHAFAQSLDNRNPACDGGFKMHHHIFLSSGGKNFIAVFGKQFFIGGNHVFTVFNGL